jgi:hypothetical protein
MSSYDDYQFLANQYADGSITNGYGDEIGSPEQLKKYIEELQEEIDTLRKSQICCDCQVGGECEGPHNCANGMRIEKLKEENKELKEEISNLQDTEKSFEIIQNITEELCDKETRIIDLEKQVKNTQEENKQNYEDKILLGIYKDLYEDTNISDADVRIHEIMDYFDDKLDGYGDDKYRLYKRSLELHGIGENGFFDENELREEYEEIYDHYDDATDKERDIEDIVEWLEQYCGDYYYELNVDKPDGTRVWIKY